MDLMASLTAADRIQVASSASMVLTWMRLSEPVVGGRRDLPSKDLSCWTKRWATCTTSSSMASVTPSPSVTGKLCNGLLNAAPFVCTALPRLWKVAPNHLLVALLEGRGHRRGALADDVGVGVGRQEGLDDGQVATRCSE
eukprot:CAMPEP_0177567178 /NCGR_PEP_ID=MMETSP0369-20130122/75085_1 /TAXON_ID=447022 ORGANISM="Scrippsiella hangoei-like, Strain SHHI-4" /NCGR_SAMPLE_ID=MMETSP0369 /ASSEMBLY_ACC=CAM_ASM_000364 /LENGTH=139 /DNA_ID=CAMNT_0019054665 /DNA_START=332 /DNA_END=751 /DNA_ORIENTATION=-